MDEAVRGVVDGYVQRSVAPETFSEALEAFMAAVDWRETWLRALMASYVVIATIAIFTRKSVRAQSLLLLSCLFGVFSAQRINSIAQENYKSFAGQAYFDQGGFFVSVMWSAPLLVLATCILVNLLLQTCAMMAQVKAQQFRREAARRARAAEAKK